jgi:di/tripeptidase
MLYRDLLKRRSSNCVYENFGKPWIKTLKMKFAMLLSVNLQRLGWKTEKQLCFKDGYGTSKNSDTVFDFDTQGIDMYVDGDWVRARGTTLGADNGLRLLLSWQF